MNQMFFYSLIAFNLITVIFGLIVFIRDAKQAKMYRWLRKQHWSCKTLYIVKDQPSLGTQTYSGENLDNVIKDIMENSEPSRKLEVQWKPNHW